ncbi:TRADD-N-associated membrane domain-containing protein [Scytonema sp. HK-05]|uniref:TRADD-N-associated membrane domain-containing protein n=1 Tax=Scytonema sp. HK-05 TaxID=1137095 RepID=UPI001E45B4B2|nr:hypothetical protein [Scytonema sp. HK-05]
MKFKRSEHGEYGRQTTISKHQNLQEFLAMFNSFKKHQNTEQPNSNQAENEMEQKIIEELLRQIRLISNLSSVVIAASAMMTLFGVGLLYLDKVPEASLTAGVGILASISSVQFAKDEKEELWEMIDKLRK